MALTLLSSKGPGSIVWIKENGVEQEFYVAQHGYPVAGNGRTLLVRRYVYDIMRWNSVNVNSYATSTIDSWLSGAYLAMLASDIQAQIATVSIRYTPGNGNVGVISLSRKVFLLSVTELGKTHDYVNVEGSILPIATTLDVTTDSGGAQVSHWTRTPANVAAYTHAVYFIFWSNNNPAFNTSCSEISLGCRPAFTLPSALYVDNRGNIVVNSAPGIPASITIPSSISGGTTVTVSWGAAVDVDGNLGGYIVERSTNGGVSWAQIYQGAALSTTNSIPFGSPNVTFRVKAYDSEGVQSGYRTSNQVTVINNVAPTVPASINVPTTVDGGKSLAVTWGAATDSDGNLTGYCLERKVDSGAFTEIFRGNALAYTDTITKGWEQITYRVRAYDAYTAYSGYTTSTTRTVNNNTPPVIVCELSDSLGVQNQSISIPYRVTDVDNDLVTVTEKIDGKVVRSYQAVLGQQGAMTIDAVAFQKVLNGVHTIEITAVDPKGAKAVRSFSFTKAVHACSITLAEPMQADAIVTRTALSLLKEIPGGAEYQVLVTNNANDDNPVWEDVTATTRAGYNHLFENKVAQKGFAYNLMVTARRGVGGLPGYIASIGGAFE